MQDRFYIAGQLRDIARLLKVAGENLFKVRAYERAARAMENLPDDLDARVKNRRLTEIDGVGNALAAVIEEIYRTGESATLQHLRDQMPPAVVELNAIPGLTLKKIRALHEALNIQSVDDLKLACEKGLVRGVKGFGEKAEAKILSAMGSLNSRQDRTLLPHALADAEALMRYLRAIPEVIECDIAGSLRRRKETVRRIHLVAASANLKAVIDRFLCYPLFAQSDETDTSALRRASRQRLGGRTSHCGASGVRRRAALLDWIEGALRCSGSGGAFARHHDRRCWTTWTKG